MALNKLHTGIHSATAARRRFLSTPTPAFAASLVGQSILFSFRWFSPDWAETRITAGGVENLWAGRMFGAQRGL